MSRITKFSLVFLILLVSAVSAVMTSTDYSQLASPTAKDLANLEKPTLSEFQKLGLAEQSTYLLRSYREDLAEYYLKKVAVFNEKDILIADKFFLKSTAHIESHKKVFESYAKAKYQFTSFELKGSVSRFDGRLLETSGKEASSLNNFPDLKYKKVLIKKNGEIVINDVEFSGKGYEYQRSTNSYRNSGSGKINGNSFSNGEQIQFTADGRIKGYFAEFKGITLGTAEEDTALFGKKILSTEKPSTFLEYNSKENTLTLSSNSLIKKISPETKIIIKGQNIILPDNNVLAKGTIYYEKSKPKIIGENSEATVLGVTHQTTEGKSLKLVYAEDYDSSNLQVEKQLLAEDQSKAVPIFESSATVPDSKSFKFVRMATNVENIRKELLSEGVTEAQIDEKITALLQSDFATVIDQKSVLPASQGGKGYGGKSLISVFAQAASRKYDLGDEGTQLPVLEFPRKIRVNGKAAWLEFNKQTWGWDYVYREQDIAKVADQCSGNCFVYGTNTEQLVAKGKGYTSTLTKDNQIFEATDYGWGQVRNYNLKLFPGSQNTEGFIQLKTEPYEKFLALKAAVKGPAEIEDGKWKILFDSQKAYSRILDTTTTPDGADLRILYNNKEYNLDVDTINPEKKVQITAEDLEKGQQIKSKREKINFEIVSLQGKQRELEKQALAADKAVSQKYERLKSQYDQTMQAISDADNKGNIQLVDKLDAKLTEIEFELQVIEESLRKKLVAENSAYAANSEKISQKRKELTLAEEEAAKLKLKYVEQKKGVFSQKITSGNGVTTYSEFIADSPLIYNTEVRIRSGKKYGETYVPAGSPETNLNVLFTPLTSDRQCIDDQIFRYAEYKISQQEGNDLRFPFPVSNKEGTLNYEDWKKGKYTSYHYYKGQWISPNAKVIKQEDGTLRSFNELKKEATGFNVHSSALKELEKKYPLLQSSTSDSSYLATLSKYTATATYNNLFKQGKLDDYVQRITRPEEVRPGDVLMLEGHSIGVKGVVEIEGKKYAELYSGSQPAVDIRVYPEYVPLENILGTKKSGKEILYAFRWNSQSSKS